MNRNIILAVLPLIALVALIAVFAMSINRDPQLIPSVLINKPAPEFSLAGVPDLNVPGFDTASLKGKVSVVNVFASWCIPCRQEHPVLTALRAETGVQLFGINQKDAPANAKAFLDELGNPYDAIGADANGRVSIDWGVYGVPETFIVDKKGVVVMKHVGPLTDEAVEREIKPAIVKAGAAS